MTATDGSKWDKLKQHPHVTKLHYIDM